VEFDAHGSFSPTVRLFHRIVFVVAAIGGRQFACSRLLHGPGSLTFCATRKKSSQLEAE